jgi:2EXR family
MMMIPQVILCERRIRKKLPPILHVCRESRAEGLRYYQPLKLGSPWLSPTYFNIAEDTLLCMVSADTLQMYRDANVRILLTNGALDRVRHLAIDNWLWVRLPSYGYRDIVSQISKSKSLTSLTVVNHNDELDGADVELKYYRAASADAEWSSQLGKLNFLELRFARADDVNYSVWK